MFSPAIDRDVAPKMLQPVDRGLAMGDERLVELVSACERIRAAEDGDAVLSLLAGEARSLCPALSIALRSDGEAPAGRPGELCLPLRHADGSALVHLGAATSTREAPDAVDRAILAQLAFAAETAIERQALQRSRAELRTLMDTVPVAIWVAHDPQALRITGSRFATELLRLPPSGNQSLTAPPSERPTHFRVLRNEAELAPAELPLQRAARGEFVRNEELRIVFDDGSFYDELINAAPIFDADGQPAGAVGTSTIITERKQAEERAYRLAYQDALTGLPNRLAFHRRLGRERERAAREGGHLALLLVDVDHFKKVNDSLGHAAGDDLLVEAARRLQQTVRKRDLVARLGGDEFAVLSASPDPADFSTLAERLVRAMRRTYSLRGAEVRSSVSVGMTIFPDDAADVDGLLVDADFALYAAKEAGRDGWRMFDPSLQEHARACRERDRDLRRAMERREFELHYQPVIDLDTLAVVEVEALLRWNDPSRGLVGPADFLPFVERSRLLVALTYWVLDAAMKQAMRSADSWGGMVPIAVNMPSLALDDACVVERIGSKLRALRVPPGMLKLEVPEAALAGSHRIASLERLRGLGVHVTVDDFGAGRSSLGGLKALPIDQIKLDRHLLGDRGGDERDRAILGGLLALAAALDVEVVAEGVEQMEQLDLVRDIGCRRAQGYLFARPMPAAELPRWLDAWAESDASRHVAAGPLMRGPLRAAGTASSAP
jgi:diguanylate cyclase (GGDEF)-like protein